jgi:hypothetical protein
MMIYSIKVSKRKNETDFEKFMLEEVFPAVDKRSLRNGQITRLVLLKGNNTGHTNEYLWLVYGGINGGAAAQQVDKIKAFGARISPMLDFEECGSWSADSVGLKSKGAPG